MKKISHEIISEKFLVSIKSDSPYVGIKKICTKIKSTIEEYREDVIITSDDDWSNFLRAYSKLKDITTVWKFKTKPIEISGTRSNIFTEIKFYIRYVFDEADLKRSNEIVDESSQELKQFLKNEFFYQIEEGDYKIIQTKINELRDLIKDSDDIQDEHKARLLKKLEDVQNELNKKFTNLEKILVKLVLFTSKIGEASDNIEPFNKRIKEIIDVISKLLKLPPIKYLFSQGEDNNLIENE